MGIKQLQLIKNAAARVLTKIKRLEHIALVLKTLHWVTVSNRMDSNVLLPDYKSPNGLSTEYTYIFKCSCPLNHAKHVEQCYV